MSPWYEIGNSKPKTCPERRRRIRNSKQIEKPYNYNVPNSINRSRSFGFFDFEIHLAPVCFGFRDSDCEFYMIVRVARENCLEVLVLNFCNVNIWQGLLWRKQR